MKHRTAGLVFAVLLGPACASGAAVGQDTATILIMPPEPDVRPIDLKQGGQFIEPLCQLIPSITAQQVEGGSFEEEPAVKPSWKREIDKPYRPWYPDGATHLAKYDLDPENPYDGKRSQRIELSSARTWAGISQDGYASEEGHRYRLRLHYRTRGAVTVRASLHGDGEVIAPATELGGESTEWRTAEAVLVARRSSHSCTLTIELSGAGALWLDRVYLIDTNAVLGIWRPDVVDALRAMKPGIIRFGGSTLEVFEWDKCLGNWDAREPYATMPWGGMDPNFVGVEEFILLCREVGAEPLICVRWTGKTPADAAREIEYFNGDASTPEGSRRAKNGHPEPYRIRYWQIGNEVGGANYDSSVAAFAEAMRRVDPSIKLLSSYPSAEVLKLTAGPLDYVCPHHYSIRNLGRMEQDLLRLRQGIAQRAGGREVRVAVTEWNTTAGDWGLRRGMLQTLENALSCSRYQNLLHRYSDAVEIAIRSNLANSFGSGVIMTGPGWIYLAPTYYSQQLYQRAAGSRPLDLRNAGGKTPIPADLDFSAVLSPDGRTLRLYGVNVAPETRAVSFQLDEALGAVAKGSRFVLHDRSGANDPEAMNSRDVPNRIAVDTDAARESGGPLRFAFEPCSVTLLELELGKK